MSKHKSLTSVSIGVAPCAFVAGLLFSLAVGVAGCGSGYEVPPQTSQDLLSLRDHVIASKAQIQITSNAARDLIQRPQQNLTAQITVLADHIAALDTMASRGREMYAGAELRAADYFVDWDRQLKSMSDEIGKVGQERRRESMDSFQRLQSQVLDIRGLFQPYMAKLLEVQKYLRIDTTAAGIKAVTPSIKDALSREPDIMKKADQIISQIDKMRGGH